MQIDYEILNECTIRQACEWIAFYEQPKLDIYYEMPGGNRPNATNSSPEVVAKYNAKISDALVLLKIALFHKHIVAHGTPDLENKVFDDADIAAHSEFTSVELRHNHEYKTGLLELHSFDILNVPSDVKLDIEKNEIVTHGMRYKNIEIDFTDLMDTFYPDDEEDATPPVRPEIGSYTTPYINVMLQVIEEEKLSSENQGKAEYLATVIREKLEKLGVRASDKLSTAMATIIRLPESQEPWKKKKAPKQG